MYSPHGKTPLSIQSQDFARRLKRGDPQLIPRFATSVANLVGQGAFPDFFGATVTLFPVPGSSLLLPDGLWVPRIVAQALKNAGLAQDVLPAVSRISAVLKSAFVSPSQRPTVQQHYDSFRVDNLIPIPAHIVLIDDVVTQGCTLLAAASRVAEAYPEADVRGFALIRTMSNNDVDDVVQPRTNTIVCPCVGTIKPRKDRAVRNP